MKQYYKFINLGKQAHNGMDYKVGDFTDPRARPLSEIGSCESGAIYFTDMENLSHFYNWGTHLAWVTPLSRIKKDSDGNKWKAHKIRITKILPKKEALLHIEDLEFWQGYLLEGISFAKVKSLGAKSPAVMRWLLFRNRRNAAELDYFLKLLKFYKTDKEMVKNITDRNLFSAKEIPALIKNKLWMYLTEDELGTLINNKSWKEALQILNHDVTILQSRYR